MKKFLALYSVVIFVFLGALAYLAALSSSITAETFQPGGADSPKSLDAARDLLRQRYALSGSEAELESIRSLSTLLDSASAESGSVNFSRATLARGLLAFTVFTGALSLITLAALWIFLMKAVADPIARLSKNLSVDLSTTLPGKIPVTGIWDIRNLCASYNALCGKLGEYKDQLQRAERETVGRYLVHEIKNLLTPIPLALRALRPREVDGGEGPDACAAFSMIENRTRDIGALLERFRQTYRFPEMRKAPCNLTKLLKALPQAADARVTVETEEDFVTDGDLRFLSQAIGNLLANALDACAETPRGGTVRVSLEKSGSNILITIVDTGAGMAPETLDRIFGEWFTTKRKGMGIGLSFALRVAQAHGGGISFVSKQGEGTTCTMTIAA